MTRTRTNWKVRDHVLTIGERTLIMGVLNITPDSFSDGGKYLDPEAAVERAIELESQGADIIDIGAESTRPGSERINAGEELRRLVPVLKRLKGRLGVPISVDTYKVEVAEKALEHGASIINDISALTWEPDLVKPVIQSDAGLILNHMRGTPETWARLGPMKDVMSALLSELEAAIHRASRGGVPRERLVIDPGIGFGKRGEQNHEILARLGELQKFALPVLVAASRKSFLGNADDPRGLEFATAAAVTTAILHGAAIVRVHDVAAMRPAVQAADAIVEATPEREEKPRPAAKRVEETIEEKRRKPVRPTMRERPVEQKPVAAPISQPPPEQDEADAPTGAPVADASEETVTPPEPPRRPFERRADAPPPRSNDRPERPSRHAPTKKFFEWRDDKPDKKPSDRRARPAGPRDDRGRDDRPPRPPFRRSDSPGGDRPGGDRPDRKPYERSGPPGRGRDDRDAKPFERRGAPPSRGPRRDDRGGNDRPPPPRRPFQRQDDDRRPAGGGGGDRPDRRPPAGGRPAFSPRDGERRGGGPGGRPSGPAGGRPPGPRRDDRGDRPSGGSGGRPPFGGPKRSGGGGGSAGGGRGPTKRPGGGAPPRGPRKRT